MQRREEGIAFKGVKESIRVPVAGNPLLSGFLLEIFQSLSIGFLVRPELFQPFIQLRKGFGEELLASVFRFLLTYHAPEKGIVVVPGVVLGSGDISRPLTIAALKFTGTARKKITAAGGTCLSLQECVAQERKPAEITLIG